MQPADAFRFSGLHRVRTVGMLLLVAIGAAGCASNGEGLLNVSLSNPSNQEAVTGQSELERAIGYWHERFEKDPRDKTAALSLARNLKAAGDNRRAFAVLQQASLFHGQDREVASEYGRLAMQFEQVALAERLFAVADDPARPDWRILSARGAALGKLGRFDESIELFERARRIAPNEPTITNNLAMAYVAAGQPQRAEPLLQAIAYRPDATPRMRQNLALVLGLLGRYTEAKAVAAADGESAEAYARIEQVRQASGTPDATIAVPGTSVTPVASRPLAPPRR
ncbi:MAG: tetratricopeptide repeat protein [Hyphomicrobiaceae bacterium]